MPMDSSKCLELQFIDFYAGLVWSAYEFKDMTARKFMAENRNTNHKLFFQKKTKWITLLMKLSKPPEDGFYCAIINHLLNYPQI